MKPRRTHTSNRVFRLQGGNEDNDLWVTTYDDEENDDPPALGSTWELNEDDRAAIAAGANLELVVWGTGHPPVTLRISPYALGRRPDDEGTSSYRPVDQGALVRERDELLATFAVVKAWLASPQPASNRLAGIKHALEDPEYCATLIANFENPRRPREERTR